MGPYTIAYIDHAWDYQKVWSAMDEVYNMLKKANINQTAGIWIYFDDPSKVAVDQLRSQLWSVIAPEDVSKIKDLWLSYQTQTISQAKNIVVAFPYKNKFSYAIWVMKAYPVINDYIKSKRYDIRNPMIELYDMTNKTIYYMVKI